MNTNRGLEERNKLHILKRLLAENKNVEREKENAGFRENGKNIVEYKEALLFESSQYFPT